MSEKRKFGKFSAKQKVELRARVLPRRPVGGGDRREHDIAETLLRRWRDQMIEAGAERFSDGADRSLQAEQRRRIAELERTLGRKTYELELSGKLLRDWE